MNLYWNLRFKSITIKLSDVIGTGTGGVTCYVRNNLSYNISVFPREIKSLFFENLLPNSKPIMVGTIKPIFSLPKSISFFLKVLNEKVNKIDSVSKKIYILGDFDINLSLNDYILY